MSKKGKQFICKKIDEYKDAARITKNDYNFIMYKWLLILNAGGLAGTITLLVSRFKTAHFTLLCVALIIIFLSGILAILLATKIEMDRFDIIHDNIISEEERFKQDKTTEEQLFYYIKKESFPSHLTDNLEKISLALFIIGIVIGILYFVITSEDPCSISHKEINSLIINIHKK